MLDHLALFALELTPDLAPGVAHAAGNALESLATAVTRRLIAGATKAAVESLPGVGGALLGGVGDLIKTQVRQQVGAVATSLTPDTVRAAIVEELDRLNLALVVDTELVALRAVAAAAAGQGDLNAALAALAQAQSR